MHCALRPPKTLASANTEDTIQLWNMVRRQLLGDPLRGHTDDVQSVVFSPDGTTLASAGNDGTVRLWDIRVESWIARACRIVGHNLTRGEWHQFVSTDRPYHCTCREFPSGVGAP